MPTGGDPLPLGHAQPSGTVWLYPWLFSGLCVWGIFLSFLSLSVSGTCLLVGLALGFGGVGAWLLLYPHLSPPPLLPISSAHLAPLYLATSDTQDTRPISSSVL